jgi:hypothetical protein
VFGPPTGATRTQVVELLANFDGTDAQRTKAYVDQFTQDHPDADLLVAGADAQLAVAAFAGALLD